MFIALRGHAVCPAQAPNFNQKTIPSSWPPPRFQDFKGGNLKNENMTPSCHDLHRSSISQFLHHRYQVLPVMRPGKKNKDLQPQVPEALDFPFPDHACTVRRTSSAGLCRGGNLEKEQ
jgi:hypothetical protein